MWYLPAKTSIEWESSCWYMSLSGHRPRLWHLILDTSVDLVISLHLLVSNNSSYPGEGGYTLHRLVQSHKSYIIEQGMAWDFILNLTENCLPFLSLQLPDLVLLSTGWISFLSICITKSQSKIVAKQSFFRHDGWLLRWKTCFYHVS